MDENNLKLSEQTLKIEKTKRQNPPTQMYKTLKRTGWVSLGMHKAQKRKRKPRKIAKFDRLSYISWRHFNNTSWVTKKWMVSQFMISSSPSLPLVVEREEILLENLSCEVSIGYCCYSQSPVCCSSLYLTQSVCCG